MSVLGVMMMFLVSSGSVQITVNGGLAWSTNPFVTEIVVLADERSTVMVQPR